MQTTTLPIKEGGLAILDLEMQCKALHCSLIKKLIVDSSEEKLWTELMLWHLNKYREAQQGLLIFKTVIGNTNWS